MAFQISSLVSRSLWQVESRLVRKALSELEMVFERSSRAKGLISFKQLRILLLMSPILFLDQWVKDLEME